MAEEEKAPETAHKGSNLYIGFAAPERLGVPEPASKVLHYEAGGEAFDYEATAAHLPVYTNDGRVLAKMFSLTFVKLEDGKQDEKRPVTFCYNGGPGCASVPVDFGGMGPFRVATDGVEHLSYPIEAEQNPWSLLRLSDLVFLDAPGTGFSAVAEDADPKKLFGIDGDADAFCRAIMEWLDSHARWGSPVYLFGESYGTVRNSVLMRVLGEHDVKVAGVTMLSSIFDWVQTQPGEDLYYLGMMPTYAATAQYFGKAGQDTDVDTWFDQAMAWNEDVLAPALLKGDRLGSEKEAEVASQMSGFIGLPAEQIQRAHLRIGLDEFRRSIIADEGKVCGRLDMRFSSPAPLASQDSAEWFAGEDAADDAVESSWVTAFRRFLSQTLGYRNPAVYLNSNYEGVGTSWNWDHAEPGTMETVHAPNVSLDIAVALKRNPHMKVAFLGGRYDAATTYWNTVHDVSCLYLPEDLKERVEFHRYGCGHMAYVDVPTLEALFEDMRAFYAKK